MNLSPKDPYKTTFDSWDRVSQLYEEKFMELEIYNESYDHFLSLLENGFSVLDVGCGPGNISAYLLAKNSSLKVTGVDVSPKMIERAKANNPAADFKVMDVRMMPKLEEKFDGIISGFCLPYLSTADVEKMILDCSQLLTECGVLYLSFVEGKTGQSGYISGGSGDEMYFYYHQKEKLEATCSRQGFELFKTDVVHFKRGVDEVEEHTILILRRRSKDST